MLTLFNTASRQKEEFHPREAGVVRMYTCGPTVYRYVHLGNLRSYLMADWLRSILEYLRYRVVHVKNITDVGHMRQELLDRGEDKMIAAALAEGKTPAQIAEFYTEAFRQDEAAINIKPASVYPKATEHVPEMIELTKKLVENGIAYQVNGNVYFDVTRYAGYGRLSANLLTSLLEGVRVEADPQKRNQTDFALWKLAEPGRMVKWPSPWGEGFPGWHIECSAMSMKYLGEQLDLHTGGVDNIFPHHEDELAQSEAATGKQFVRYWVHGQHLLADGLKMAKSTGNSYTLSDIVAQGFEPMAFRYLCLTTHYRARLNFTFSSLRAAQKALIRLRRSMWQWQQAGGEPDESESADWWGRFFGAATDDMALPKAVATLWDLMHSPARPATKLAVFLEADKILRLRLTESLAELADQQPPAELVARREAARRVGDYATANRQRDQIERLGFRVQDGKDGGKYIPASLFWQPDRLQDSISSSKDISSRLDEPDQFDFSVTTVARGYLGDVQRFVNSVLDNAGSRKIQLVVVDNGTTDGTGQWLQQKAAADNRLVVVKADHQLGEAEARNVTLKSALGKYVVLADTSVEVTGEPWSQLERALQSGQVGLIGPWGVKTTDLQHFHEVDSQSPAEVDAVELYWIALRRDMLKKAGLLDEKFRFYRNLDLHFSFQVRDLGLKAYADPTLPIVRHEHRWWTELSEVEREKLSHRNFRRFYDHWHHHHHLLVAHSRR